MGEMVFSLGGQWWYSFQIDEVRILDMLNAIIQ